MRKNGNVDIRSYPVKFPKNEKAYAFITYDGIPFKSAVVGITNPTAEYSVNRSSDTVICLFEYIVSGEGEVFVNGKWQTAAKGDFYILSSGTEQIYRSSKETLWEKMWINYVSDYMPHLLRSYGVTNGVYHQESVKMYFEDLIELTKTPNPTDDTAFKIADRLHKIVRVAAMEKKAPSDDEYGMRKLLSTYIYKKIDLNEFADKMHMSKSNVIRIFKKKYGTPPYEYLINLKLEAAKILLKDTKLPIKEIADKLCIYDEHYFSSLFLKKVGMRPGKYRSHSE